MSQYLNVVNPAAPCTSMPAEPVIEYTFPLDPFQQHAIAAISADENVLVTAKTGSGKTLVGEYQIAHSLKKGKRVFYTTPIKSLSNQKYHDLKKMFPSVGIMTGDIKFCPHADVVIMTTEILRNLLFKRDATTKDLGITANLSIENLDAVVFDECHYINDKDRGAVWEETMILLPRDVNLVLLSATIESPELFAGWLGELKKKPIHLISTQYRIVPLQHGMMKGSEIITVMDSKERFDIHAYKAWLAWREGQKKAGDDHKAKVSERRLGGYENGPVSRGTAGMKAYRHQMNELIGNLDEKGLLPALFFVFSRKGCERFADEVEHTLLDSSETASVKHILDFHLHRYGDAIQHLPQYHNLRSLLEKGIAFHHSGLISVLKEIVEILFSKGFVKLLFATETFAVGINMPTKTVVFTGYKKYDDATNGMRLLRTDEYIQMAGRAGRRGKDDKGLVLYLPEREAEEADSMRQMMTGSKPTFQSRMTFHYDFLLKTLQAGSLDWLTLMRESYWFKRHDNSIGDIHNDMTKISAKIVALQIKPEEVAAMEEHDVLRGSLKTAVNAAKKDAQRAWTVWDSRHFGPRWANIKGNIWTEFKKLRNEYEFLESELLRIGKPENGVWPSLVALGDMGFLQTPVGPEHPLILTSLGISATEVNEAHQILMPLAFRQGLFKNKTAEEVLVILSTFLGEPSESNPMPDTLSIPRAAMDAMFQIEKIANMCQDKEEAALAARPPKESFWALNTAWSEPIWRWIQGTPMTELCADYEFYEGNFLRILLKMVNILEELRSLATLATDTELLHTMREAEQLLMREAVICDSLYLRI
jgi:superfamily II RNA helicase